MNKAVVHKLQSRITWDSLKSTDAGSGPRFLSCVAGDLAITFQQLHMHSNGQQNSGTSEWDVCTQITSKGD